MPEGNFEGLRSVFRARRSVREFSDEGISINEILGAVTLGLRRERASDLSHDAPVLKRGPYPSAGGLYGVETYVAMLDVTDNAPCVVHYHSVNDEFALLGREEMAARVKVSLGIEDAPKGNVSAAIIQTLLIDRSLKKYGPRGYRFGLLEAGHASQCILLSVTALGLGALCWGGYYDDEVNRALDIDDREEFVTNVILLGNQ